MTEGLLELLLGNRLKSTALTNRGCARVWAQHDTAVVQDVIDEVIPRHLAAQPDVLAHDIQSAMTADRPGRGVSVAPASGLAVKLRGDTLMNVAVTSEAPDVFAGFA